VTFHLEVHSLGAIYLFAGAFAEGFAAGVAAGFAGEAAGFAAALAFAAGAALALVFALAGAAFAFDVFAAAGVEEAAPAGRAPLSSFGLSTTFFARKFSILASFIAIA
jgi:hypothetical protein